jgi:hypothetical protein
MNKKKPPELWRIGNTLTREQLIRRFEARKVLVMENLKDVRNRRKLIRIDKAIKDIKEGKIRTHSIHKLKMKYGIMW